MPTPEPSWPDPRRRIPPAELARLCELGPAELDALAERGELPAAGGGPAPGPFDAGRVPCAAALREAVRLRRDHGLDFTTLSLLFGYLLRIAELEHQVRLLQPHLSHAQQLPREGPTPWREPHA